VQYQGDLIVSKLAMGCASLNVKLAGSLQAQA
jgi:hypothetical protein